MEIIYTNDFERACALRDAGYEPIECAFGQHGSVLGPFALDHHGTESHREGVAIRGCRDHYGALSNDPRFVVTGTPDADAVLAIVALAGLVPADRLRPAFYELVDHHDVDPIGLDLLQTREGVALGWFNQRERLMQSSDGFYKGIEHMCRLLTEGITQAERDHVIRADRARRRNALDGVLALLDADGRELPLPEGPALRAYTEAQPVQRGVEAMDGAARVLVVKSTMWGFDQWYRLAPVVVSYASRMAKVTIGCPDVDTAERLFGPGGLAAVWPHLGQGWGGRETIGGSPRGVRLKVRHAHATAETILSHLR